jgi:hypothetical protein
VWWWRRPLTDKVSGEMLTELTVEVVETDEVPVMGKRSLKEEVVVRDIGATTRWRSNNPMPDSRVVACVFLQTPN